MVNLFSPQLCTHNLKDPCFHEEDRRTPRRFARFHIAIINICISSLSNSLFLAKNVQYGALETNATLATKFLAINFKSIPT